jgi:hypothetical protein
MEFRGVKDVLIKVTNCCIEAISGSHRSKVGHGCLKWPLIAPDVEGGIGRSKNNLPSEHLNKDRARRLALARALKATSLSKEARTIVWETYFQTFLPKLTPPAATAAVVGIPVSTVVAPVKVVPPKIQMSGGVISKVVNMGSWLQSSRLIH